MTRAPFVSLIFAALSACDAPPSLTGTRAATIPGPSFAHDVHEKIAVSHSSLFNPCPPEELVAVEGHQHLRISTEVTPTSTYMRVHLNNQDFKGVGLTSGDRYSLPGVQKVEVFNSEVGPTSETTSDGIFRMLRQGSADNLWLRVKLRFRFPPGETEVIKLEIECRG